MKTKLLMSTALVLTAVGLTVSGTAFAQPAEPPATEQPATDAPPSVEDTGPAEVVTVTAQKRTEALQDVPVAETVFTEKAIEAAGIDSFLDYAKYVPSLSFASLGPGQSDITIRGLPLITGVPTVGVYVDGISVAANFSSPDPRLFDVRDVQILRGPQGTLYGEGSVGGLVIITNNQPNADEFQAKLDATYSETDHADEGNHELNGMINVPIVENRLALRAVGYQRSYAGFIDLVSTGNALEGDLFAPVPVIPAGPGVVVKEDANTEDVTGGRVALGYTDGTVFDVTLTYSFQDLEVGGDNLIMPDTRRAMFPGVDEYSTFDDKPATRDDSYRQLAGELNYDFGGAAFYASAGYHERELDTTTLFATAIFDAPTPFYPFGVVIQVPGIATNDIRVFQAEARFVSTGDGPWQWIVGGTYRNRSDDVVQTTPVDNLDFFRFVDRESKQYAVFGEGAYSFESVPVTLRAGLRYFVEHQKLTSGMVDSFGIIGATIPTQGFSSDDGDLSPRFVAEWHPTDDVMIYGSISKGFRSGGINVDLFPLGGPTPGFQPSFEPDSAWAYELGAKTAWYDNALILNGALFYIDWSNLQIDGVPTNPSLGFTTNAGSAHSQGIEAELTAEPVDGLTVTLGGALMESELDAPAMGAPAGSRLPNTPEWMFNAAIEYTHPILGGNYELVFRADAAFRDNQFGNIPNVPNTTPAPIFSGVFRNEAEEYEQFNLRLTLQGDFWSATLFGENITDEKASSFDFSDNAGFGFAAFFGEQEYIGRPRTIGIQIRVAYN